LLRGKWWRSEQATLPCYEWRSKHATLRCEECKREARSKETRSWRAYLTVIGENEPAEVVVYCPDCAKREFGDDDDLGGKIPTVPLDELDR
jgi:hypothetical protein